MSVDGDLGVVSASAKRKFGALAANDITRGRAGRVVFLSFRLGDGTEREERSPGQGRTGH